MVRVRAWGAMVTAKIEDAEAPDASVTPPVNSKACAWLGVPESVPELLSESPFGKPPPRTDHE